MALRAGRTGCTPRAVGRPPSRGEEADLQAQGIDVLQQMFEREAAPIVAEELEPLAAEEEPAAAVAAEGAPAEETPAPEAETAAEEGEAQA